MKKLLPILLIIAGFTSQSQNKIPAILPLRTQAEVVDKLFEEKVKLVLPDLMQREGIDMWLVMAREYTTKTL